MIAYLILAHRHPALVVRLARRLLEAEEAVVVVHYDIRSGPFPPSGDERIHVVDDPLAVRWGDISVVDAVLHGIRWFERAGITYHWLALLSGQDYPIVSPRSFEQMLNCSNVAGFVEHRPLIERFAKDNATRYEFSYWRLPPAFCPIASRLWRINNLQPFVRIVVMRGGVFAGYRSHKPFDKRLRPYRGSCWWILSRECIARILATLDSRPEIHREYARKLIPDESFVSTLAANAGLPLANDDLRFIVWPGDERGSPLVLTVDHLPEIATSGAIFVRKVDPILSADLLDALDRNASHQTPMEVRPISKSRGASPLE